jgi:MFS family permease
MNRVLAEADGDSRRLSRADVKTLLLAALGGALEFYDFVIFVFFTAVIAQLFFPPATPEWLRTLQTFGLFAAGYLARPLGGVVMAHFGDRHGRKRMFLLSVLLMALPTLAIGLLPTYAVLGMLAPLLLLVLRVLQGIAVGGEVPGAWVFVAEHVPRRRVGLACGSLTAGLTAGILLGSLVAGGVHAWFTPAQVEQGAWRLPFLLGGAFGLMAVWLRRYLAETPVFEELRRRQALEQRLPLAVVLREHRRSVVGSMALTWMLTAAIVVLILMLPTLAQTRFGVPAASALHANTGATLALTLGCIGAGWLCDRIGAGVTLLAGCALLLVLTYVLFNDLAAGAAHLGLLYAATGLCVGVVGAVPVALVGAFPATVRFSGVSFSYNVAYALFGGLTPLAVSIWMHGQRLAPAHYVAALCVLGMVSGLVLRRRG